jgi:hypothetical protein
MDVKFVSLEAWVLLSSKLAAARLAEFCRIAVLVCFAIWVSNCLPFWSSLVVMWFIFFFLFLLVFWLEKHL